MTGKDTETYECVLEVVELSSFHELASRFDGRSLVIYSILMHKRIMFLQLQ